MREIQTDGGSIKLWDSIKELPIDRFTDFQKYLIQDSGIGSTIEAVSNHFKTLDTFLALGKIDEARVERYNMHYNLFVMLNRIQITHLAFSCFVVSINGEVIEDYSEGNLLKVCEHLGKIKLNRGQLEEVLSDIKKKLIPS